MSQFLRSALPGDVYIEISLVSKRIMLLELGIVYPLPFPYSIYSLVK